MSRQFSEKDASEILKAAAKLQQEAASGSSPSGVSVDDLKKIAEESGIDPNFVDQALLTQAAKNSKGSDKGRLETTIEGELSLEQFGVVQESLSSLSGYKLLSQVGRTIQGTVQAPWCQLRVEVFSRNGKTRIQVTPIYGMTFMMTGYAPALIGFMAFVFGTIRGGILVGAGLAALFGTVSFLATMFGFKKANESAKKVFDQLVTDLSAELKSSTKTEASIRETLSSPSSAAEAEAEGESVAIRQD
jgi:hypothetical protein